MAGEVLRVLNGARAGAEVAIPASGRASIGHEYWHDVVLREASTRGCALELEIVDGVARLTVLDGTATLLGSTLATGDTATLPAFVPVSIGNVAFAYGEAGSARWDDAALVASAEAGEAARTGTGEEAPPRLLDSARDSMIGRLGRAASPRALLGIAAALLVAFAAGPAIDALQLGGTPAEKAERALHAAGFGRVQARDTPNGEIAVSGYVGTEGDRQRVQQIIEAKAIRATVAIETGDESARAAVDVARTNGVEARARPLGAGGIELTTEPLDEDGRSRVGALIRRDVPSLRRIVFRDDPGLGAQDDIKTIADATKRVSTVVAGDPGYIITVDGARYFPGAVMPSGHRLVAVEEQTVVLERNGRRVKLKF